MCQTLLGLFVRLFVLAPLVLITRGWNTIKVGTKNDLTTREHCLNKKLEAFPADA